MGFRLLLDEHFSGALAEALGRHGVDVVAASATRQLRGLGDEALLAEAASQGRMLVTYNVRDFAALARQWAQLGKSHAGILLIHPRTVAASDIRGQVRVILETLRVVADRDTTDLVLFAVGKEAD